MLTFIAFSASFEKVQFRPGSRIGEAQPCFIGIESDNSRAFSYRLNSPKWLYFSTMLYCSDVWGDSLRQHQKNKLHTLQRDAILSITGAYPSTNNSKLLELLAEESSASSKSTTRLNLDRRPGTWIHSNGDRSKRS